MAGAAGLVAAARAPRCRALGGTVGDGSRRSPLRRSRLDAPPCELGGSMSERAERIRSFLAQAGWEDVPRRPLAGDASFRRYERLQAPGRRAVLMDAPPPQEDVRPFLKVARLLKQLDLSAPEILAEDIEAGRVLLRGFRGPPHTKLLAAGGGRAPPCRAAGGRPSRAAG